MNQRFVMAMAGLLLLCMPMGLFAVYQENLPQRVVQPDGSVLELLASGDEFFNFLHDSRGYTIVQGQDGFYYWAIRESEKVVASPYRVDSHDPELLGLEKRVRISPEEYSRRVADFKSPIDKSLKAPHTGPMVNLVIYIRFADDEEFTTPRSTFDLDFNLPQGPSLRHYFQEVSYGQLDIESYHFPETEMHLNLSYQDIQPRGYYQPQSATNTIGYDPGIPTSNGTNPNGRAYREHTLLKNAIQALAPSIPTSLNLDGDNDGRVDNVSFIIRGQQDGWNSLLWAHRWVLWSQNVTIHGKRVYDYTFQPETQSSVYVLCHEMFHSLGAPDLYHYNNTGFTPVGPWDLMHSGFVHMGAYMKWKYAGQQWITELPVIGDPGTYTLNPLLSPENNVFRINTPNSHSEFFVVEYRKRGGHYETNIPGEGLLIYRINTLAGNGNAQGPPDEVYLYRVDGTLQQDGNIFAAHFSEQSGRTQFTDYTNPRAFLLNDLPSEIMITNITAAGETISFDLMPSSDEVLAPVSLQAELNENHEVVLNWSFETDDDGDDGDDGDGKEEPQLSSLKVFRSATLLSTIHDPLVSTFVDKNPPAGDVTYFVRAIYDEALVSPPSPVVTVSVPSFLHVVEGNTFDVGNEAGNQPVQIRSNLTQWNVFAAQPWVQPFPASGAFSRSLFLYYTANPGGTPRTTTIAVGSANTQEVITLRQGYNVSVGENQQDALRIYPNPSFGGFVMVQTGQLAGNATLRLIDLSGRTLQSHALDARPGQSIRLSTTGLPAGVYVVEISTSQGVLREKVMLR